MYRKIISSYLQRYENNIWVPVKNWSEEIHGKKFYFDWISGVPDTASARTWDQQLLRWGNEHQTNTPRGSVL